MAGPEDVANRIAVLILTHNHEKYIGGCIESILRGGLTSYRIWILDDGSTDGTREIVRAFARENPRIVLLTQTHSNGNTSRSSQRLIDESTGEYVVLMSGDDLFGPSNGIARNAALLDSRPALVAVIPRMVYLMEDPSQTAPASHEGELLSALRTGDPGRVLDRHLHKSVSRIFLQGMMIRRRALEEFNGFDVEALADDYAFVMRLFHYMHETEQYFQFDESTLWLYRVHSRNIHRDPVRQFILIAEVVNKYVPTRRKRCFQWDAMIFQTTSQLASVREQAIALLGHREADLALAPAMRVTLKSAAKRGDVPLIWKILWGKGVAMPQRVDAALQLPRGIIRELVWRWQRCR